MSLMINDLRKNPNNTNKNFNEKMEEMTMNINNINTKMDEIRMANILEKLDKSGIKVGFTNTIPEKLTNPNNTPYQIGFGTDDMPKINEPMVTGRNCCGLIIEGSGTVPSPEVMELLTYTTRHPEESAPLVAFCQKCLLAGNVPVRKVDNYFICSNGKVLVRNGEDFEIVYEGVILPNLQTMNDKECLDVIRSAIKTHSNLINQNQTEEKDLQDIGRAIALASSSSEELHWIDGILSDIERADKNDDVIRQKALMDALISWLEMKERDVEETITDQSKQKEEPKCDYEDDGQQNWIF